VGYSLIYVADLREGATGAQRMIALVDLGHNVSGVHSSVSRSWIGRLRHRMGRPFDSTGANARIQQLARTHHDILWIDKGVTIRPHTLREARAEHSSLKIVGYSPDDMTLPANQSSCWLHSLPLFDVYFTTKSYGVEELRSLGCRNPMFVGNAFDPHTHRPVELSKTDRDRIGGVVGFVGVQVTVYGDGWQKRRSDWHPSIFYRGPAVYGQGYARLLNAFDINLAFLRRAARDKQTTRTMEIPACGKFMLAERSGEHVELFREGVEAEFFGSDDELLEKTRYYIAHPQTRQRIAVAGYNRCINSGYSNHDRMRWMLEQVSKVRLHPE
jgi:spore maturation protein CgeB